MRMFWLDATEQNGTIYLIGKVAVPTTPPGGEKSAAAAAGGGSDHTFLSACVAVHGIEREVLVLPRYAKKLNREECIFLACASHNVSLSMTTMVEVVVIFRTVFAYVIQVFS